MKMFLLGILAWSAFCAVCYTVATDDEQVHMICGGPVVWVIVLVIGITRSIHRKYRHATIKALMEDNDGNIYWCESADELDLLWGYSNLHPANIEGIKNVRYTPKAIWKSYPRIPDDIIQKAKADRDLLKESW